jgi:uncharacterized protein YegL
MGSLDTRKIFEEMDEQGRRLPVYLLLDVSGSMSGTPIAAVQQGINTMLAGLNGLSTRQKDTIYLRVIKFSDTVDPTPLVALRDFSPPTLVAAGLTSLGAALRVLDQAASYNGDLIKNTIDKKGDWKPVVFLLTDGDPTDDYQSAAATILKRTREQSTPFAPKINVIAIGCGDKVNAAMLHEVTDRVYMMGEMTQPKMVELFAWVTATLGNVTRNITSPTVGEEVATEAAAKPSFLIES